MKLSIEATDKLENKDFHYELIVSQTHVAMVCGTVLASLALIAWMKKKQKKLEASSLEK
ncbi:hypothetical protein [Streptococcus vestibularis]|uniref:Uncharacterized protein n=1 Tax=Streptococcus vestibularis TaxID=1343 RepID=A0A564SD06_STRVE|nr:hypothetical protein [Streptococcus vestibularis]VUW93076.1 Uncharacterised protein [Streptococcus vestibularis]